MKEEKKQNQHIPIAFEPMFKSVFENEKYPNNAAYITSVLLDIPYEEIEGSIIFESTRLEDIKFRGKDVVFLIDCEEIMKEHMMPRIEKEYLKIKKFVQCNLNDYYIEDNHPQIERRFFLTSDYGTMIPGFEIIHINMKEMNVLWHNGSICEYDERMQNLIRLGTLIMEQDKVQFEKCLNELNAPVSIKKDIKKIVKHMNQDNELNTLYYNYQKEENRINISFSIEARTRIFGNK